ncbi:MAG: hypothetical protein IPK01_18340 [Acidobacteria bacterium]|nr:hypothetical protein [Acidobacteriota bacterium]
MESFPPYISIAFMLTTFMCVGILFYAIKTSVLNTAAAKITVFCIGFWLLFTAILARGGFYEFTGSFPPRVVLFGVLPANLFILSLFLFARLSFIENLPLRTLTFLHIVRIPVEIVLLWLFQTKYIPQVMTFDGINFDIISGITAPIVCLIAFRKGSINRPLLIVWNICALVLLAIIVITAVLAFPSQMQQIAFDQPNRAIMFFPLIWLPTVIVPIVLFSHLASLWKLILRRDN